MTTALGNNAYNSDNSQAADYLTSWQTALENGRWAVSQSTKDNGGGHMFKEIYIDWTEDASLSLNWTSNTGQVRANGTDLHTVSLRTKVMLSTAEAAR